ncbi:CLUMA_CG008482, isoform A [Clunio marinus]|uniref:CLUMA_CG008482, isoform A n=1 Tax=Clunio marinus TaxID=568069 RepID=A0A1J1I5Y6_9DIPT|nr:CLUMA_CG008482, isoform A [Clunio marinus]
MFSSNLDISNAQQNIEIIKQAVIDSSDPSLQLDTLDDLNSLLFILEDPIFRDLIKIQDVIVELNGQLQQHPSILPADFDIVPTTGELVLNVPRNSDYDPYVDEQRVPSAQISPRSLHSPSKFNGEQFHSLERNGKQHQEMEMMPRDRDQTNDDRPQSAISNNSKANVDIMASEWAQVQAIELVNDGTGLGFGIIGAKTSGVIVKTILAGGVADRDCRLLSGDHILQIGEVNLHEMGSEQVAAVLRQSGTHVRLVVARAVDPLKTNQDVDGNAAIVPSRLLNDPYELNRYLIAAGYPEIFGTSSTPSSPLQNPKFNFKQDGDCENLIELPETERFTVELRKDSNGLGITIAGYVCEKEELSGIFVKSVAPGSVADCGKIQVNDRIIEVDGKSLHGYTNHQAVDVLKQSGNVVKLCIERYLRGLKFEQLQQAIAANVHELKQTQVATSPESKRINTVSPASSSRRQSFNDERKLVMARDSIETKLQHEMIGNDFNEQESSVDNEEDLINELTNQHIHSPPKTLHKYHIEPKLTKEHEAAIIKKWRSVLGNDDDSKIIVAQIRKFAASSGLGISLEGTVDVEGGREVRPHHYIRSILPEGPVGSNGLLRSGDELLEVNNQRLLGMNHMQVVSILKELPQDVRMVCRRGITEIIAFTEENNRNSLLDSNDSNNNQNTLLSTDRLVKAKSDGSLSTAVGNGESLMKMKSRSLEPLTGLAMWSSQPQIIELVKGERGLGFSILDYQDPLDPNDTLIVIRSLVPGGVAQIDGRLIPGDRLLFVNETRLENASLDQAVQALKGAPKGIVRIGIAKPLPMSDFLDRNHSATESFQDELKLRKPDIIME